METPIQVSIPRNEITIIAIALVVSVIYNVQTSNGIWSSISLITILAFLIIGSILLTRIQDFKTVSMVLLSVFIFATTAIMIGLNIAFYKTLGEELKDGYGTPILITNILHGTLLITSLIGIVLISMNILKITPASMKYYENAFSIVITLILLNSGLMAGA